MTPTNQRDFYRVEYPHTARPVLAMDDGEFEVIDCSESGLRFELSDSAPHPTMGDQVQGVVRFREDPEVEIEGVVARVYGRSAAVRFTGKGIPFSTMISQQRYLRRSFPRGRSQ